MAYHQHSPAERQTLIKRKLRAAFHEVKENEPGSVAQTRAKFGAARARKQNIAIALSKARAAGAHIPRS